jgi:hypothetical protein
MISDQGILFIEPTQPASDEATVDHFTRRMTAAFRQAIATEVYKGLHLCVCGACGPSANYRLPNGERTNSLCVHYLAHHRSEVPPGQLDRIGAFASGEQDPNDAELQGPELVLARVQASVENTLGADRLNTWTHWGLDLDRLSRNLRGGWLPAILGYSPVRREAEDLLSLLGAIQPGRLGVVRMVVEQNHGDVRRWAEQALRIPGWNRGLWVSPLVALIQSSEGSELRTLAENLLLLGSAARAAVPKLMELAKRAGVDRKHQYDLGVALHEIGNTAGVDLVRPILPKPGPRGVCSSCSDSGDCYCKRRRGVISQQCFWCDGSGKCHVCSGVGTSG